MLELISKRYRTSGDALRAQLLHDDPAADLYRSNARMDALAELMAKPDKSPFDEFITGTTAANTTPRGC